MSFAQFLALVGMFFNNHPALAIDRDGDGYTREVDLDDRDPNVGADVCGFTGHSWPNVNVYTETDITVERLSPDNLLVPRGDSFDYTVEITNANCGWAVVDFTEFSVTAWGNSPWIEQVQLNAVPMTMEVPLDNTAYESVGSNVLLNGEQLFYEYEDGTNFDAIWIAPGDSVIVNFTFDDTSGLTIGDTFEINLLDLFWSDVTTSAYVGVMMDDLAAEGMTITAI